MKFAMTRYIVGIRYEDERGESKICGGAIIGASIVLTAAHCVPKEMSRIRVLFGDSMRSDRAVADLAVSGIRVHEKYAESKGLRDNPFDIAVIRTEYPLPAEARHLQLADGYYPVSQISKVYVAGYGAISQGREGKTVGQGQLHAAIVPRSKDHADDRFIVLDQSKGTGICAGDDGAPALVENADGFILMGIASTASNEADEKNNCAGISTFINVHTLEAWIIEQAFEMMQSYR